MHRIRPTCPAHVHPRVAGAGGFTIALLEAGAARVSTRTPGTGFPALPMRLNRS